MTEELLIDEETLREALRPRRPDAEAFGQGVRERIAERKEAFSVIDRSPFLRQAAALLPPGLAPVAWSSGGLVGKQAFGKLAASFLTLPILILAMTGVTFVAGIRSLRRLDAGRVKSEKPLAAVYRWWVGHPSAMVIVVLGMLLLGWTRNVDILLGVVLLSMASLTWVLRKLSSAGYAGRQVVGVTCGYTLFMLAIVIVPLRNLLGLDPGLQNALVYGALFIGGLLCYYLAIPSDGSGKITQRHARVVGGFALGLLVLVQFAIWRSERVGMDREELVAWVEEATPGDKTPTWRTIRETVEWLRDTGGPEPDLGRAEASLRAAIDGVEVSPYLLGDAADLGLLDERDWPRVLADHRASNLLARSGRIMHLRQSRAHLIALRETGGLDDAARAHVTERLLATWDPEDRFALLETLVEIVRDLEKLGAADAIASLDDAARAAVREAWLPEGDRRASDAGGFVKYYRYGREFADVRATDAAVQLMIRFGVPEEIDLLRVYTYLRHEATYTDPGWLSPWSVHSVQVTKAVALARFEESFDVRLPERSFAEVLLDWRLTIGLFLLTGLCLYATSRAPES